MPLSYEVSSTGAVRQCELLEKVWEHRPESVGAADGDLPFESIFHPLVLVLSPDCDLDWDFAARQEDGFDDGHNRAMPSTLVCDAFVYDEIRERVGNKKTWREIGENKSPRHHHLGAFEGGSDEIVHPDLYLDFKRSFSLPTAALYRGLESKIIGRAGVVAPIYSHHIVHRLTSFQGRVALPDE